MLNCILLILSVIGGITVGMLATQMVDLSLGSEATLSTVVVPREIASQQLQQSDFQVILNRNLFDSVAGSIVQLDLSAQAISATTPIVTTKSSSDFTLIGTVVAGEESLALIAAGKKIKIFQIHEEISPRIVIAEIGRKLVVLNDHGKRIELLLKQRKGAKAQLVKASKGPAGGVVAVDEDHWKVSKSVVANARANLSSLLKTARVIPQVNDGKTIGFKVVELRNGSLLTQIGLRIGDLIVKINDVELNSPEKALQIFQQVREANNLSLSLVRNGQPKTFEYSFE